MLYQHSSFIIRHGNNVLFQTHHIDTNTKTIHVSSHVIQCLLIVSSCKVSITTPWVWYSLWLKSPLLQIILDEVFALSNGNVYLVPVSLTMITYLIFIISNRIRHVRTVLARQTTDAIVLYNMYSKAWWYLQITGLCIPAEVYTQNYTRRNENIDNIIPYWYWDIGYIGYRTRKYDLFIISYQMKLTLLSKVHVRYSSIFRQTSPLYWYIHEKDVTNFNILLYYSSFIRTYINRR